MANRFVEAWARQDFAAMHAELTPEAQAQYPVEQLAAAYQEAQNAVDRGRDRPRRRERAPTATDRRSRWRLTCAPRSFGVVDGTC